MMLNVLCFCLFAYSIISILSVTSILLNFYNLRNSTLLFLSEAIFTKSILKLILYFSQADYSLLTAKRKNIFQSHNTKSLQLMPVCTRKWQGFVRHVKLENVDVLLEYLWIRCTYVMQKGAITFHGLFVTNS